MKSDVFDIYHFELFQHDQELDLVPLESLRLEFRLSYLDSWIWLAEFFKSDVLSILFVATLLSGVSRRLF